MSKYSIGSRQIVNTTTITGIVLMLPFAYGTLFQSRPKNWVPEHASIAMLEIAGFVIGVILVMLGLFA